jgi:septal ring factor EnvC (AmiA/AmiB activator)
MSIIKLSLSAIALSIPAVTFTAHAQTQAPMSNKEIDAQYRADQKRCDGLKGNEKDVCQKEARAARDTAKADAKQAKEQAESRHDATKKKRESAYDVAKAKCDTMSGNAKDACMADAKTRYGK